MDLDALLFHYFGTDDLGSVAPEQYAQGKERLTIDFGVEKERSRRFALWTLMESLSIAPAPAIAFEKEPELKRAAEDYLTAVWKMAPD